MASSLISRSHHNDFDSVFRFDDAEIVQMFESLITTGLKEFLGCPAIFHENALTEFFANGSVRDGVVVSTIGGIAVEISESVFAATFGLPTEGLTDISEVPRNLLSEAQSLFSVSEKEVSISCLKKEIKMQYRLLSDFLAKSLFVKAGSFDAVTRDRFLLMMEITFDVKFNWGNLLFGVLKEMVTPDSRQAKGYAIQICVLLKTIPGLELGESKSFPAPRILNEKTVNIIVSVNEKVGVEEVGEAPRAKKTPVKKTMSKKRQTAGEAEDATEDEEDIVEGSVDKVSHVPVQVAPIMDDVDMIIGQVISESAGLSTNKTDQGDKHVDETDIGDDFDKWLDSSFPVFYSRVDEPVVASTNLEKAVSCTPNVEEADDSQSMDIQGTVEQAGGSTSKVVGEIVAPAASIKKSAEEHMSFDDILLQIHNDMLLPSITAAEVTMIRLGEFSSIGDKGKAILVEDEQITENPASEIVALICRDVEVLVRVRDSLMKAVVDFFASFSLNTMPDMESLKDLKEKEKLMMEWAETNTLATAVRRQMYVLTKYREMLLRTFLESCRRFLALDQPWSDMAVQVISLLSAAHSQSLEDFKEQQQEHKIEMVHPNSSLPVIDSIDRSGVRLALFYSIAKSIFWVRPMVSSSSSSSDVSLHFDSTDLPVHDHANTHTSAPVDSNVFTNALEDLRSSLSQRIHESTYEIRSKVNDVEFSVRGDLLKQQAWLRQTFQNACEVLERQSTQMNDLKKGLMAPVGTIFQDLFDIKKNQRAQEAKLNALDGQVAAIRNEQMEFQSKISADLLSLSTQFAEIVDYIRGGDAKKGEGGSSSRPPPVRVESRPLPTPQSPRDVAGGSSAVRIPTFTRTTGTFAERAEQARRHILESGLAITLEEAVERVRQADIQESDRVQRERDRARREKRSSSYKRRRGF
ncbi:hypothetical protein F511_40313 [Dorcoceras hygrometricum]|uniref:Dystroglycan-like n=1 Tax=Dorcoceras hygrometricum TaxID=472368 RepID=A0A2Z7A2H2_9LAMI|nr:hypothetical protein F511_40313 [Dorcoceras hygrometricum]